MIQTLAWTKDKKLMKDIELSELFSDEIEWFWVNYKEPSEDEIKTLDTTFKFHPLAIEDCLHTLQRPKIDYFDDYNFFVIHALNQENLEREEVDIFLGDHFIVTFHYNTSFEIDLVRERFLLSKKPETWDQHFVFHQVMDKIVDQYFPIVYRFEDHLNDIEDNTKNLSMERLLDELFDTRHELLTIRQTINPMRDLLYRVLNSHRLEGVQQRKEYFSDIHDHLLKVSELVESSREMTQDIRDSYLSLNAHQTNKTMKVLTVISTIFMPLTFIAGVYGMNFSYMPELEVRYAYFAVLGFMTIVGVLMFMWFKQKGWFD